MRVLVGRTEVITPQMKDAVKKQVSRLNDPSPSVREEARLAIQKLGRFYEPVLKLIVADEKDPLLRARIQRILDSPSTRGE